jgi:hypothetical protein
MGFHGASKGHGFSQDALGSSERTATPSRTIINQLQVCIYIIIRIWYRYKYTYTYNTHTYIYICMYTYTYVMYIYIYTHTFVCVIGILSQTRFRLGVHFKMGPRINHPLLRFGTIYNMITPTWLIVSVYDGTYHIQWAMAMTPRCVG